VKIVDNIPGGRTICAFGEACSWPVQSFVTKFKDEFVAKGKADEDRREIAAKAQQAEEDRKKAEARGSTGTNGQNTILKK
jgi:NADH-quinone oxidoreductase subunit F